MQEIILCSPNKRKAGEGKGRKKEGRNGRSGWKEGRQEGRKKKKERKAVYHPFILTAVSLVGFIYFKKGKLSDLLGKVKVAQSDSL